MTLASRIGVMNRGEIVQIGTPTEIYEFPMTKFVADFIGNVNLMHGTLVEDEADHCVVRCADCTHWVGHGITGSLGMAVGVALRPEKITLSRMAPDGPHGALNRAAGSVKDIAYFGSYTVYHLALASGALLKVSQSNTTRHREDSLTWGDTAWASWPPTSQVVLTQ
jgi:putrescine transport system ATP-binding protein